MAFGCGHTRKKALFPVRSTLVKFPRAILSSVVGDHMRNYGAAIFLLLYSTGKHRWILRIRAVKFFLELQPIFGRYICSPHGAQRSLLCRCWPLGMRNIRLDLRLLMTLKRLIFPILGQLLEKITQKCRFWPEYRVKWISGESQSACKLSSFHRNFGSDEKLLRLKNH